MLGIVVLADANTSAGAPLVIWVASVFEPANEYVSRESIAGKTSVSDEAAKTVTGGGSGFCTVFGFGFAGVAAAAPATSASAASSATSTGRRELVTAGPSPRST